MLPASVCLWKREIWLLVSLLFVFVPLRYLTTSPSVARFFVVVVVNEHPKQPHVPTNANKIYRVHDGMFGIQGFRYCAES